MFRDFCGRTTTVHCRRGEKERRKSSAQVRSRGVEEEAQLTRGIYSTIESHRERVGVEFFSSLGKDGVRLFQGLIK